MKKNKKFKPLLLLPLFMAIGCQGNAQNNGQGGNSDSLNTDTVAHQVTLLFAGDLMQHDGQIKAARMADGTYNYDDVFARVKDEVSEADLAIAVLRPRRIFAGQHRRRL